MSSKNQHFKAMNSVVKDRLPTELAQIELLSNPLELLGKPHQCCILAKNIGTLT
jgi:hypothetical protein